jgi:hypothetical protein
MQNTNSTMPGNPPDFFKQAIIEYRRNPKDFNDYIEKLKISAPGQAAGIIAAVNQGEGKDVRDK